MGDSYVYGNAITSNNLLTMELTIEKEVEEEEEFNCEICRDTGTIEIMGGSDYDDWTVVDTRRCVCVED